ncbi:transglycosylase SLT domain-containing protein [Povalibacter sp.]|uniref:transglycosylase SLT domain-containing protein n=1 Tax=Povalibacter sp. TaxID=1962978 RepID=UPI002F40AB0E
MIRIALPMLACILTAVGCSSGDSGSGHEESPAQPAALPSAPVAAAPDVPATPAPESAADTHLDIAFDNQPWHGDLDKMIERRVIRVLVPYSKMFYFIDAGTQRGLSYEIMESFGNSVNEHHKLTKLRVTAIFLPTSRDQLLPALRAGLGDVVAANLTVTPSRQAQVDFVAPLAQGVKEILVTAADAPIIATIDGLSGQEVFVRKASSYYESLNALNASLKQRGKPPIVLREAPATFEDEDVLEMVNAGLVKFTVVDRYLGTFWSQVFKDMKVREDLIVHDGGDIAFAIRKNSPQLKAELDVFMETASRGTTFGNVVIQKYLQNTRWVKNSTTAAEMQKFAHLGELFRKYSKEYRVDWVLMAAQGYQESGLDQKVRSRVGAIGVMQVMPATGKDLKVGDIRQLEPNIHAGIKYVRFMIDEYYADEPMDEIDKALFAFASYNAGPNRIRSLRKLAEQRGLDPNKWFNNVERVVAEKVGRETVQYVSNIYKHYIAYTLAIEQRDRKHAVHAAT